MFGDVAPLPPQGPIFELDYMRGVVLFHMLMVSFTYCVPLVYLFALGVPSCTSCATIFPSIVRTRL